MPRITKKQLEAEIIILKGEVAAWKLGTETRTDDLAASGKRNIELLDQIEERDNDNRLLMQKVGELTLELARQEEGR